jgi:hypothetical protein
MMDIVISKLSGSLPLLQFGKSSQRLAFWYWNFPEIGRAYDYARNCHWKPGFQILFLENNRAATNIITSRREDRISRFRV